MEEIKDFNSQGDHFHEEHKGQDNNDDPHPGEFVSPEGFNTHNIYCRRCGSTILLKGVGKLVESPRSLPLNKTSQEEHLRWFWFVKDMWSFENLGFSMPTDNNTAKYLTCADCESEILGVHVLQGEHVNNNFLCHKRVELGEKPTKRN